MKRLLFLLLILTSAIAVHATHNRAGEISVFWVSGLQYSVTMITYTKDSAPADRPELVIKWGDGTQDTLPRANQTLLGNDIKRNIYYGTHTYTSIGTYTISMEDPNRNSGVQNIPSSVQVPFYIETTILIDPNLGPNNTPILLNPPIDNGCVGQPFIHNPGAFDTDGDSLSYALVACRGLNGQPIPGYSIPSTSNTISIDPVTGDFYWDSPVTIAEYNIAIEITEHRKNSAGVWVNIGRVLRDMQITIAGCNNTAPVIQPIQNICVTAGDTVVLSVSATDVNFNIITLTASGGPFLLSPAATFTQNTNDPAGTRTGTFRWPTDCAHVRQQPYAVTFKATDNGIPNLVDLETMNITVVSPGPTNLTASAAGTSITLGWTPTVCTQANGYDIYRKKQFYGFVPGPCETGVPGYTGYVKIASVLGSGTNDYVDNDNGNGLIHGITYCYMVVATFDDGAESYASEEICASLKRDVPLITQADVETTGQTNGMINVKWTKATEFDTIQFSGPYVYKVFGRSGIGAGVFTELATIPGIDDTTFTHTGINTLENAYTYRIDFFNQSGANLEFIGSSRVASSVFLSTGSTNNAIQLNWDFLVPWINDTFVVYRENLVTGMYDSLTTVTQNSYLDAGLVNMNEYCYYVMAVGYYTTPGIVNPLLNRSQRLCDIAQDTTAPCAPELAVEKDCELLENYLDWTQDESCGDDVVKYEIYYTPIQDQDFVLLATLSGAAITEYWHSNLASVAGCYAIVSVDSFGNSSAFSNIVCVDNCPEFDLPNVFTPNNDGENDFFKPISNRFVESIEIIIYNRWGKSVFTTTDPNINWDGNDYLSGQPCSEGVYYYVCKVNEIRLTGLEARTLEGFFHLFR